MRFRAENCFSFLVTRFSFAATKTKLAPQTDSARSAIRETRNEQRETYLIPRVAASASCFFEKYHCLTSSPLPEVTRLAASSCVCGAGTMTGSPGFQFAGVAQALASAV